jgi:hypothetical protein
MRKVINLRRQAAKKRAVVDEHVQGHRKIKVSFVLRCLMVGLVVQFSASYDVFSRWVLYILQVKDFIVSLYVMHSV